MMEKPVKVKEDRMCTVCGVKIPRGSRAYMYYNMGKARHICQSCRQKMVRAEVFVYQPFFASRTTRRYTVKLKLG